MGLLSDGGVHSHINHLYALIDMAKSHDIQHLFIHPIMDGRDTSPTSGIEFIEQLEKYLEQINTGQIASIVGRFWAMDRDTRWDRVEKAYQLYTRGTGTRYDSAIAAVQAAYEAGKTDEFISPMIINSKTTDCKGTIKDGDGLIFFNFRADRAKEITTAFTQDTFNEFNRPDKLKLAQYVSMTQYDEGFRFPAVFGPQYLNDIFGQILSQNNLSQLRIAETEKYAHVTYFFNGGDPTVFNLEQRILIPSPRDVATYDEKPEMSAQLVAQKAIDKIHSKAIDFVILNFANMDMVGHTGILDAAIKGCETIDKCAQQVVNAIWETNGMAFITADHGNAEQMIARDGSSHTAHTLNPVPFILAAHDHKEKKLHDGILGDIAPTILKLLNIDQPSEMTGTSLI